MVFFERIPIKVQVICGITSPTQLILPHKETADAVKKVAQKITIPLTKEKLTPKGKAVSLP